MKKIIALLLAWTFVLPAWAASQVVTLSVPGMNCATCPITVRKALVQVPGVSSAEVNLERREARITFDDAKTSVEALRRATTEAGYPSTIASAIR